MSQNKQQFCPNHQDREISWICLEKVCDQRAVCNLCAVKFHNRDHKVEEYNNIKEQGFINLFFKSEEEYKKQFIEDELVKEILLSQQQNNNKQNLQKGESNQQQQQQQQKHQLQQSQNNRTSSIFELNSSRNLTGQIISSQFNFELNQSNQLTESKEHTNDFEIVNDSQEIAKQQQLQQLSQSQVQFKNNNQTEQQQNKKQNDENGESEENKNNDKQSQQQQEGHQDEGQLENQENKNKDLENKIKIFDAQNYQDLLQKSQENYLQNEFQINKQCQKMTQQFEQNIKNVLKSIQNVDKNINNQQIDTIQNSREQKENGLQKLKEIQQELTDLESSGQLQEKIDEALKIINEDIQSKAEIPVLKALLKKQKILEILQANFTEIIQQYLDNNFTTQLCQMFQIQIQTVQKDNSQNLQNQEKFIDHLSNQWKQEYTGLKKCISNQTDLLNQVLHSILEQKPVPQYTISSPSPLINQKIYTQTPQKPQVIINHKAAIQKQKQNNQNYSQNPQLIQQQQQKGHQQYQQQQQNYAKSHQQVYNQNLNQNNQKVVILSKPAQNAQQQRSQSPNQNQLINQDLKNSQFDKNATTSPIHMFLNNNNKNSNIKNNQNFSNNIHISKYQNEY